MNGMTTKYSKCAVPNSAMLCVRISLLVRFSIIPAQFLTGSGTMTLRDYRRKHSKDSR